MLEYCSKGDLRQYLIKNRRGFETSLKDYKDTGLVKITELCDTDGPPSNVIKLYQWAFQVKYFKQTYDLIEYSIKWQNKIFPNYDFVVGCIRLQMEWNF